MALGKKFRNYNHDMGRTSAFLDRPATMVKSVFDSIIHDADNFKTGPMTLSMCYKKDHPINVYKSTLAKKIIDCEKKQVAFSSLNEGKI